MHLLSWQVSGYWAPQKTHVQRQSNQYHHWKSHLSFAAVDIIPQSLRSLELHEPQLQILPVMDLFMELYNTALQPTVNTDYCAPKHANPTLFSPSSYRLTGIMT